MTSQVPPLIKSERARRLAELGAELRRRYFHSLLGHQLDVLVESQCARNPRFVAGTSCRYAPVQFPGTASMAGKFVTVRANHLIDGHSIAGELQSRTLYGRLSD